MAVSLCLFFCFFRSLVGSICLTCFLQSSLTVFEQFYSNREEENILYPCS